MILIIFILFILTSFVITVVFRDDVLRGCDCSFHIALFLLAAPILLLWLLIAIPYNYIKKLLSKPDNDRGF
jgi:hypothetical protein